MPDAISALFPATFPALALAHFAALLSPGPDFFLIVGHSVRGRLRGAALICVGIALGNALYIGLAVIGWAGLKQHPALYRAIEFAGACYLAWMGYMLLRSSRSATGTAPGVTTPGAKTALSKKAQFCAGLASALLNPKNAIFYLTLMTGLLGPGVTLTQQATAGVWMVSVVLLWDLAVAAGISHPRMQNSLTTKIPLIEGIAGLVLAALATGIFWSFI